jgi:hypothetical protein
VRSCISRVLAIIITWPLSKDSHTDQRVKGFADFERPADLRRLDDADANLRAQRGKLVVMRPGQHIVTMMIASRTLDGRARNVSWHGTGRL